VQYDPAKSISVSEPDATLKTDVNRISQPFTDRKPRQHISVGLRHRQADRQIDSPIAIGVLRYD